MSKISGGTKEVTFALKSFHKHELWSSCNLSFCIPLCIYKKYFISTSKNACLLQPIQAKHCFWVNVTIHTVYPQHVQSRRADSLYKFSQLSCIRKVSLDVQLSLYMCSFVEAQSPFTSPTVIFHLQTTKYANASSHDTLCMWVKGSFPYNQGIFKSLPSLLFNVFPM